MVPHLILELCSTIKFLQGGAEHELDQEGLIGIRESRIECRSDLIRGFDALRPDALRCREVVEAQLGLRKVEAIREGSICRLSKRAPIVLEVVFQNAVAAVVADKELAPILWREAVARAWIVLMPPPSPQIRLPVGPDRRFLHRLCLATRFRACRLGSGNIGRLRPAGDTASVRAKRSRPHRR